MKELRKWWFVFLSISLFCGGCTTYTLFPNTRSKASNEFIAGAAEIDITPHPGYPMGGFGGDAQIGTGIWTPLKARALYLKDSEGNPLVMVSCDLWSVPAGLTYRVIELLNQSPEKKYHIGTGQILLSATHTHHSQAAFASSMAYNLLASVEMGFDEKMFDFISQRLVHIVKKSIDEAEPAEIAYQKTSIAGWVRNRSIEAFRMVDEVDHQEIKKEVSHPEKYMEEGLPSFVDDAELFQAVDPYVYGLRITDKAANSLIAVNYFYSFHPTTIATTSPLYSADVLSIISSRLKSIYDCPILFYNGTEGDVSLNWKAQTIPESQRISEAISTLLIKNESWNKMDLSEGIKSSFKVLAMDDQDVSIPIKESLPPCYLLPHIRTARQPVPGMSILAGAEDGRTHLYHKGYKEGVKRDTSLIESQGEKPMALYDGAKDLTGSNFSLINIALTGAFKMIINMTSPRDVPIGVYRIGKFTMATIPGECTTVLGHRIKKSIRDGLQSHPDNPIVITSLTNEYLSYFTTPAEYSAQHYEGASTMYGFKSGNLLQEKLAQLSTKNEDIQLSYQKMIEGISLKNDFRNYVMRSDVSIDSLISILFSPEEIKDRYFLSSGFSDADFFWDFSENVERHYYPAVSVEYYDEDNHTFRPLNQSSDHMITYVDSVDLNNTHWRSIFFSKNMAHNAYRFKWKKADGSYAYSEKIKRLIKGQWR